MKRKEIQIVRAKPSSPFHSSKQIRKKVYDLPVSWLNLPFFLQEAASVALFLASYGGVSVDLTGLNIHHARTRFWI